MNEFRLRSTGDVLTEQQVRESVNAIIPTVIDADTCEVLQIDPVFKSPLPSVSKTQYVKRDGVEQDETGHWFEKWVAVEYDQEIIDSMLAKAKAEKNAYINKCRYDANYKSFKFAGKDIACDMLSRSDIESTNSQIMKHNALPAGWPGGWRAMDNEYVAITDVVTWNLFYDTMYATGMSNFAKSQQMKAVLENATLDTIDSIVW